MKSAFTKLSTSISALVTRSRCILTDGSRPDILEHIYPNTSGNCFKYLMYASFFFLGHIFTDKGGLWFFVWTKVDLLQLLYGSLPSLLNWGGAFPSMMASPSSLLERFRRLSGASIWLCNRDHENLISVLNLFLSFGYDLPYGKRSFLFRV